MAEKKRPPQETKERSMQQFKTEWQKTNRREVPPSEMQKYEKQLTDRILPKIYEGK